MCGWLKDKFGVSCKLFPRAVRVDRWRGEEKASRATQAMLQMKKIDISKLEEVMQDKTKK